MNTQNVSLAGLPARSEIPGHPYHIVEISPWPLTVSVTLIFIAINGVGYFNHVEYSGYGLLLSFLALLLTSTLWLRDINNEGTLSGDHTFAVQKSLTLGFILFVISEIFFFLSIFWAYLHSGLSPAVEIGALWPPIGIEAIDPFELPLLNTVLLLSSGAALTYGHHALINKDRKGAILGLGTAILFTIVFTGFQVVEYWDSPFTLTDGVYGSCFYFGTFFHGVHVALSSLILVVVFVRIVNYSLTNFHHVGFESGAIYAHIVDVVWLFLWLVFYYWGS